MLISYRCKNFFKTEKSSQTFRRYQEKIIFTPTQYAVIRIDSHGNEYEVGKYPTKEDATKVMNDLHSGGHHQHYYCELITNDSHKSTKLFRD